MEKQPFTPQEIFNLKLETIEHRLMNFYEETQNSSTTIQLVLALRVRYQLGAEEFALALKELVRYLFKRTKASRTMKRFFYYFVDYFDAKEWKILRLKLFPVRNFIEKAKSAVKSQIAKFLPTETAVP
ncbi:hypothetical protein JZO70_15695 [Enterococcus sp. 669A]|uniref:Transposase n=1 Tax=Candidatus Enterococcus moelleringii TaxID=2815325 RepID=A0ABS3LDA7_9ENTE|nr:hypothetical protein [Enterococcus sp. 669A]MBO1307619.1 hypothetical protein [Enterococcus sp. 669A]